MNLNDSTIHIQFTEYQILSEKAKKSATFVADFERHFLQLS
jgi:hypothetical protein